MFKIKIFFGVLVCLLRHLTLYFVESSSTFLNFVLDFVQLVGRLVDGFILFLLFLKFGLDEFFISFFFDLESGGLFVFLGGLDRSLELGIRHLLINFITNNLSGDHFKNYWSLKVRFLRCYYKNIMDLHCIEKSNKIKKNYYILKKIPS